MYAVLYYIKHCCTVVVRVTDAFAAAVDGGCDGDDGKLTSHHHPIFGTFEEKTHNFTKINGAA